MSGDNKIQEEETGDETYELSQNIDQDMLRGQLAAPKKSSSSSKAANLSNLDILKSWFAGKDEINGTGKAYGDMLAWLKKDKDLKIFACTVFYEKPIEFLSKGETKTGKGDSKPVDSRVLNYLPIHSDETLVQNRSVEKYGVFIKVNFTMVKRVALYGAEHTNNPKSLEWVRRYGGKPSAITIESIKGNDETKRIKWETVIRFRAEMTNYKPQKN
jgi:hypothetical protein